MTPAKAKPAVAVILGSKSDLEYGQETMDTLKKLGVRAEIRIISAHRTPEAARDYAKAAADRGVKVIVALAGAAAHLPGVIAAWSELPVIGVPLPTSELRGLDSLYAIVQMPGGVPVAAMAIGKAGARNAAIFAAQILAQNDAKLAGSIRRYRADLAARVMADDAEVASR